MEAAGGWFYFLTAPKDCLIVIVRITPPGLTGPAPSIALGPSGDA